MFDETLEISEEPSIEAPREKVPSPVQETVPPTDNDQSKNLEFESKLIFM